MNTNKTSVHDSAGTHRSAITQRRARQATIYTPVSGVGNNARVEYHSQRVRVAISSTIVPTRRARKLKLVQFGAAGSLDNSGPGFISPRARCIRAAR